MKNKFGAQKELLFELTDGGQAITFVLVPPFYLEQIIDLPKGPYFIQLDLDGQKETIPILIL